MLIGILLVMMMTMMVTMMVVVFVVELELTTGIRHIPYKGDQINPCSSISISDACAQRPTARFSHSSFTITDAIAKRSYDGIRNRCRSINTRVSTCRSGDHVLSYLIPVDRRTAVRLKDPHAPLTLSLYCRIAASIA